MKGSRHLKSVVGKDVEMWRREEVETVLWWHHHLPVVNVPEQRVEALRRGHHFSYRDQDSVVGRTEGSQHPLEVRTPGGKYGLVTGYGSGLEDQENICKLLPGPEEPPEVLLDCRSSLAPDILL